MLMFVFINTYTKHKDKVWYVDPCSLDIVSPSPERSAGIVVVFHKLFQTVFYLYVLVYKNAKLKLWNIILFFTLVLTFPSCSDLVITQLLGNQMIRWKANSRVGTLSFRYISIRPGSFYINWLCVGKRKQFSSIT